MAPPRTPTDRAHFFDFTPDNLVERVEAWGMPRFRAGQLLKWVYERGVTDPQQMSNLSKADRRRVAENLVFEWGEVAERHHAGDGTRKLLLAMNVGTGEPAAVECVMIPAPNPSGGERRTACISSQVGCPVGCRFCASGLGGLEANLTAGQIVEQVHHLNAELAREGGGKITNIVFMGMGEPLSNFPAVTQAVRTLNAEWGLNISGRRITISTVGLPAQIRRLADQLRVPATLALSLHAPTDELRRQLIPWAEYATIDQIMDACRYYFRQTGREITIEYTLMAGTNDQPAHARQLAKIARAIRSNVNLIRYNEVAGLAFGRPEDERVVAFQSILRDAGVNAHIRASRGRDIAAACGQLRHEAGQS